MSTTQSQAQPKEQAVEFIPFGADEPIKLTPKMVADFIAVPTKSGKLPEHRDCVKFIMMCRARKLNPFEGDCFMIGYDTKDGAQFSIITAHQAFLKRAEVHPEYDGMQSGVIVRKKDGDSILIELEGDFYDDDQTLLGGWATIHFKSRKYPMKKKVKLTTFDKSYGQWQGNKAGMIVKCAEADGLRSAFPTMLGGLYLNDEIGLVPKTVEDRFTPVKPDLSLPSPTTAPPAPLVAPPPGNPAAASSPDAPKEAATMAEAATASPAQAPTQSEMTSAPVDDPPEALLARCANAGIAEAKLCAWACAKYKLSPCETIRDLSDIAPRRVAFLLNNFEGLLPEIQASR